MTHSPNTKFHISNLTQEKSLASANYVTLVLVRISYAIGDMHQHMASEEIS